jgi:ribonuclease R
MADEGILARVRKNCYMLARGGDFIRGRLQLVRRGYGFVIPESGGRDIFIKSFNLGGAFDGDRVEVRLVKKMSGGNPEGAVERVLSRARKRFVGIIKKRKNFSVLDPGEEKIFTEILIPARETARLRNGQKVLAEVFEWGESGGKPLARVVRTLDGRDISPVEEILLKYDFPENFPAAVLRESAAVPGEITGVDLAEREDFRHLPAFTIDPGEARDFDDALSVRMLGNQEVEVGVHIADVSHYVAENTAIDREAGERAMSVYLDQAYVPMLPPELSAGICSLVEGVDRLTMSVIMRMNPEGEILGSRIVPGVIRSRHRYDYEEAQDVLDRKDLMGGEKIGGTAESLLVLQKLSEERRGRRKSLGQIDFDLPEPLVIMGSDGEPVDIKRKKRLASHRLVEEFMVTANEIVARALEETGLPAIYRIHEEPDAEAVEYLNYQLGTLDPILRISSGKKKPNSSDFSRVIEKAEQMGFGEVVSSIVIRGMKRAFYSTENIGHFGLASSAYTHFTSPIRRYPDLLVHRLLKTYSRGRHPAGRALETLEDTLARRSSYSSQREQLIDYAERESADLIEARFMSNFPGQRFPAMITSVKSNGFRVQLENHFVEGFVYLSRLTDDFYDLDPEKAVLTGRKKGRTFRLGQKLEVILTRSDPQLRRIDFVPPDMEESTEPGKKRQQKGV